MGSVASIVSSLLDRHLHWEWADPACSLLVAVCILAAALPLLHDSARLLLREREAKEKDEKPLQLPLEMWELAQPCS